MDNNFLEIALFVIIVIVFSIFFHFTVRKKILSSIFASLCAAITFQFVNYLYIGYLDPFFKIAFLVTLVVALLISVILEFIISEIKIRKK